MATRIINFSERRAQKTKAEENECSTQRFIDSEKVFCVEITELLKAIKNKKNTGIKKTVTPGEFRKHVEERINASLIEMKLIKPSYFFCAMYVARLLSETIQREPETWYAFDYREKAEKTGSPYAYKEGGDMCFLIASLFQERGNWRLMTPEYYNKMGILFYSEFYYLSRKEIGHHMSKCFETMSEITHSCVTKLE